HTHKGNCRSPQVPPGSEIQPSRLLLRLNHTVHVSSWVLQVNSDPKGPHVPVSVQVRATRRLPLNVVYTSGLLTELNSDGCTCRVKTRPLCDASCDLEIDRCRCIILSG
ncbi:hypothetical protein GBAR_LOCUS10471, partial [Geodia barretti]